MSESAPVEATPAPVDASVLDTTILRGFHLNKRLSVLLPVLLLGTGLSAQIYGEPEPTISMLRLDGETLRIALDELARITGGHWAFDGAVMFTL